MLFVRSDAVPNRQAGDKGRTDSEPSVARSSSPTRARGGLALSRLASSLLQHQRPHRHQHLYQIRRQHSTDNADNTNTNAYIDANTDTDIDTDIDNTEATAREEPALEDTQMAAEPIGQSAIRRNFPV